MKNSSKYHVLGLMSGTSLDGLDMAHCTFEKRDNRWVYKLNAAETINLPERLSAKLKSATNLSGEHLTELDNELGRWYGTCVNDFLKDKALKTDLIASHGHTVFHQPERGITLQIGSGVQLHVMTDLPVVNDFRSKDVALGGQGAPLVPIGDKLLFSEYSMCLNLGGIANVSFNKAGKRLAFDIGACNMVLNYLAEKLGLVYDEYGLQAESGVVNSQLKEALNQWDYYSKSYPKSLGYEDVSGQVFPIIENSTLSIQDKLATYCDHLACQITNAVAETKGKLLVTGGGAFNNHLIERITFHLPKAIEMILPDSSLISFKEAIVFAFLGVLRIQGEINCLSSVTGASRDCSAGVIYE
ncbi:MAG: anhydro-N-acetylmuramic acid kinase [Fulvivirga sp.]